MKAWTSLASCLNVPPLAAGTEKERFKLWKKRMEKEKGEKLIRMAIRKLKKRAIKGQKSSTELCQWGSRSGKGQGFHPVPYLQQGEVSGRIW